MNFEQMMEESIKSRLEKDGTMAALRSEMHVKVLRLLRGQQDSSKPKLLNGEEAKDNKTPRDQTAIKLINQLIMEFFNWFGYKHTLETFRMESGNDMATRRELEEELFITPESKDLPLLTQLVMRDWKSSQTQKKEPLQPAPETLKPQPSLNLKEKQKTPRSEKPVTEEKLIQNNQKLIASDPLRKAKQMRTLPPPPPPPVTKRAEQKVSVESSESDILDSDYSEESGDSDLYADIPDRHVFVDDLPPEGKYTTGQGEESGSYNANQSLVECLYQRHQGQRYADDIPSSSKKAITRKGLKVKQIECNSSASDGKTSSSGKQVSLRKSLNKRRSQTLSKSELSSDKENELPVTRPQCPETHIAGIDLDSEDSCEDEVSD